MSRFDSLSVTDPRDVARFTEVLNGVLAEQPELDGPVFDAKGTVTAGR